LTSNTAGIQTTLIAADWGKLLETIKQHADQSQTLNPAAVRANLMSFKRNSADVIEGDVCGV
jgi:hypothetical protein